MTCTADTRLALDMHPRGAVVPCERTNPRNAWPDTLDPADAEYERLVLVRDLLTDAHGQLAQARALDTRRIAGTYRLIERALTDALADTAAVVDGWEIEP